MSESEWGLVWTKHSIPKHINILYLSIYPSPGPGKEVSGQGAKNEINGFLFYSPSKWKMWEAKRASSLLCICQHISRRPGHIPGTGWLRNRDWRSPRLGGLLLSLWLNSQAGGAGAAPNDSWVLKSHTRRTERATAPSDSLPPLLTTELGWFTTFFCALRAVTTAGCLCAERCSCKKTKKTKTTPLPALSEAEIVRPHTQLHPSTLLATAALPHHRWKMLVENPAVREYTLLSRGSHPPKITSLSHDTGKTSMWSAFCSDVEGICWIIVC